MTHGKMYEEKKAYVDRLNDLLKPLTDFEAISYARDYSTDGEYLKVTDTIGQAWFINVTGNSHEAILKEVCRLVIANPKDMPHGMIHSTDKKRYIAPLFK